MQSPLLATGLLQTVYFLNQSNSKHVRLGFFQEHLYGTYSLQVRFYQRDSFVSLTYEEFSGLLIHLSSISECLRNSSKLVLQVSAGVFIHCNGKRITLRKDKSSIFLLHDEWKYFNTYTLALQHILQFLYVNSQSFLSYAQQIIDSGTFTAPSTDQSYYNRIYYEIQHNGFTTSD